MMTPPTVAPGSVIVMRRQGTSHDAAPSSFYVPSPLQKQQGSMGSQGQLHQEGNGGNSKPKKSWGERLKLGKSEKCREDRQQTSPGVSSPDNNNYLLQEYRNKYGTLSSGSALSKSMKYAETWLYGSVAVRSPTNGSTPRPSLFLYHPPPPVAVIPAVIPPGTNYAVVMCSCPEFLTGTARSKKSSSAVCKKCGGSRVLWNVNKGGGTMRATGTVVAGGTVRGVGGTLRLGGGSSGQNRVRPSLLSLQTSPNAKSPSHQSLKSTTPDPYDLMRRNRLGGVNNNEAMLQYDLEEGSNVQFTGTDTLRVRAKSTSPCRRRRSPSPPVIRTVFDNVRTDNGRRVSRRDLAWEHEYSNWNAVAESADNSKRKSILECDVNAYELIAKYLKNGNRPAENGETKKIEACRRPNSVDVTSDDDVLEDELSDDLSDNALENSGRSSIPAPRNQSQRGRVGNPTILNTKTESTSKETKNVKPANVQTVNKVSGVEKVSNTSSPTRNGVTLGGQRIRIFNETSSTSSVEGDNGYVDNDVSTEYSRMNGRSSVMTDKDNDTKISRQQEKYPKNTTATAAAVTTSSLIPRLASPRRPPRKSKTSTDVSDLCNGNNDIAEEENENESTALPNGGCNIVNNNHVDVAESSLSQAKDGRATTEGVCIIKSILKKPSTSPGETSTSSKTFGDTISKPDFAVSDLAVVSAASSVVTAAASSHYSPSPEAAGSSDFYLPTFQEFKQQHRKKKQVQFKVADDVTAEEVQNNTTTVRNTVNKPASSSSEEKTLDAETQNNKQPSVKINNWTSDREEPSSEPLKVERKKKDVKFSKQDENPLENVENEVKDENVLSSCDKKQVANDNVTIKTENCDNDSVKLKYFGEVDVNINNVLAGGAISPDSGKGASDISTSVPHAPFILGGKTSASGDALVKERLLHGGAQLRRSQSERLLPTTSGSLRGNISPEQEAQFKAEGSAALFNDTMRLRLRPGRPDIREVFSDPGPPGTYTTSDNARGSSKRPQRMLSPGRPRPKEPPPPPPPPSSYALLPESTQKLLPELPPRQIFPFTKKQIEQMNQQARQFSIKSNSKPRKTPSSLSKLSKSALDSETAVPSNIRPVSWSPLAEKPLINSYEKKATNVAVRKKEHRHSDPGPILPKLVVHVESSQGIEQKEPGIHVQMTSKSLFSRDQEPGSKDDSSMLNFTSKIEDRNDGKIRTIVTVSSSAPGSPLADVHRLQVRAEDPVIDVSPSPQRRTSILINGEDCMEEIRHLSFGSAASVTSLFVQEDSTKISPVKKDSSNKVTISVGAASDSEIKSQSSLSSLRTVIDTSPSSTLNFSKSYSKNSSLTLLSSSPDQVNVIPVTPDQQVQRTLLVVDHNDSVERIDNMVLHCWNNGTPTNPDNDIKLVNNTITIVDSVVEESSNIVMSKSRGVDLSLTTPDLEDVDVLLNPVEAIRRNLIPHVCGKKITISEDESDNISPTERLNKLIQLEEELNEDDKERETLKEGDYFMASAVSKFVDLNNSEETPMYSNIASTPTASKSSEDTLPTVIEQEEEEEEGDDDVFQPESLSLEDDIGSRLLSSLEAEDSRTDDKSFTGESSGCDTAPSSIEPENEGTDGKDEDDISTSDLPLSLPFKILDTPPKEKDNQDDEVELRVKSCNDNIDADVDNIYESIKDPIYEEIPDTPPPLPLSPPPSLDDLEESKRSSRSIFEGASKYDILSYLVGAKERGIVPEESYYGGSTSGDEIVEILDGKTITDDEEGGQSHERMTSLDLGDLSSRVSHLSNASDSSEDSCNLMNIGETPSSPNKVRKSSAEIERNDSGVGSETSKSSRSRWQHSGPASSIREDQQHLCEDCDQPVETQVTDSGVMFAPLVCRKCGKKRAERKEIIAEIVETEEKYGRDLQIIMDEFYKPMLVAGLLSPDQLAAIFLNVEELLEHNVALAEKLRDNMEIALEQGDEDLLTVNIGKLFLEAAPMLHTFESYCIRQGAASMLLANLEKEKELLRIFLRVSQMENAVLRRMNLNSFLMVPVQRVTKYPLLLARLHKVTPAHHEGRELLRQSQHKIELHLEHMNSEAKDISTTKLWRRISIMNGRRASSETDMLSIKLRKMALDILEWNHDEVRFAMEGKLLYTNPADNNWRKGRTIKLNPINALLVTNGKPTEDYRPDPSEDALMFPRKTGVREATLLLLKEKCGRYTQLREPLYLDKCIVCSEAEWEDYFEVQELASKDTFIFKAEDGDRTKLWYRQLQYHAQGMGAWRRRRNALANIMINGMQTRN